MGMRRRNRSFQWKARVPDREFGNEETACPCSQLTGIMDAPFCIVAPFRVGSHAAGREKSIAFGVSEESSGVVKSR